MASLISLDLEEMSARIQKSLNALAELPQHSTVAHTEGVGVGVTASFRSVVTQAGAVLAAETEQLRRSLQDLHDDLTMAIEDSLKAEGAVADEKGRLLNALEAIDQGPAATIGAGHPGPGKATTTAVQPDPARIIA